MTSIASGSIARNDLAATAAEARSAGGNSIAFEGVTVRYRSTVVLDRLDLDVAPGEIVALIGPSGSGKTTALRAVAGFVQPAAGRVKIGGIDVTELPPYARDIGMVVQNYALFPHMRVADNVAFGLAARKTSKAVIAQRVDECLRVVGMTSYKARFPRELSGGQQQRVAIARALAIQPRVLLLDEPLSALDAQIRRSMVEELAKLHRTLPTLTILYVTHDQSEALTLADRIAIMRDGKLTAYGPSRELYRRPPNRFTAEFLGRANLLPVRIESVDRPAGRARVRFGSAMLETEAHPGLDAGDTCALCIRPHDLRIDPVATVNAIEATVDFAQWQGDTHNVALRAGGVELRLSAVPMTDPPEGGATVRVSFAPERASLVPEDLRAG